MTPHCDIDRLTFNASAYTVKGFSGIAFHVAGWETAPDADTDWTGIEVRTGRIIAVMIGDDYRHRIDPDDLTAITRRDYCGECGQIGCGHDGLDRSEGRG
jgi:hypothetical protein